MRSVREDQRTGARHDGEAIGASRKTVDWTSWSTAGAPFLRERIVQEGANWRGDERTGARSSESARRL